MIRQFCLAVVAALVVPALAVDALAETASRFLASDVFDLEFASDPQIHPDGEQIAYVRTSGDIMTDRFRPTIWRIGFDGSDHRALAQGPGGYTSPRWSPSGDRLAYIATESGRSEIRVLHAATGAVSVIARPAASPRNLVWAPDGESLVFAMFVPGDSPKPAALPAKPQGAEWAPAVSVIDALRYRADGQGYLKPGHVQLFSVPADGGAPRQLTDAAFDHDGRLSFTPDGARLIFSMNAAADVHADPIESDLYALDLTSRTTKRLTDRDGPDAEAAVSPDGARVAYVGFDDKKLGHQNARLYLIDLEGGEPRTLTKDLDLEFAAPTWAPDGRSIFALYDEAGVTKLGEISLDGDLRIAAENLGGATLGRPYPAASFSVGKGGRVAATVTSPERPADLAAGDRRGLTTITALNDDVLKGRTLARVERIEAASSADGRAIEAWVAYPPGFDRTKKHPLILEIHGGPFANYGPRFAAEIQLYAAAGYVVVYANPRGSTSYGEDFANLIHHAYPGQDYDDLMSVVDAVVDAGGIDEKRLFVTGGSGGGVLTAWIVGKTDRFAAAAVQKPVINWTSMTLTSDISRFVADYWFGADPWEDPAAYWSRSPLSLVGDVRTPTMVLTGEVDFRTPMSDSEQYYQALHMVGVKTRLVRMPEAAHGIANRPSHLVAKIAEILAWFEMNDPSLVAPADE